MLDPLWSATHEFFKEVGRLLDLAAGRMRGGGLPSSPAVPVLGSPSFGAQGGFGLRPALSGAAVTDLVNLRNDIRGQLDVLKARLLENLTERETYLTLFPIVLHIDEEVQKLFQTGAGTEWPTLQKELFEIDNGGEAFYEQLDDLTRKPNTFPFIYQAYYLCLSAGFTGRYHAAPTKVQEYKALLAHKIPVPKIEQSGRDNDAAPIVAERVPYWSYGAAIGLVLLVWIGLRVLDRL
ncbi:MAG: DotU family type IV/VI secretion system protein [Planctomycetota bacterium]|jgi:type IV/VI secretion system ImpK/VasF family protein